ncbi:Rho-GAP domain-containing protein [Entamoeba marina]
MEQIKKEFFRICGSQDTIQSVKNKLELGDMSVLQTVDIHSLASTLKQYIREFPSQVVPPEIDRDFIQLYKAKQTLSEEEVLSNYISIIKTLPPIIYEFVKEITELLHLVLLNAESNKMTVENIFICLGPALRGCPFCYNYATTHYDEVYKKPNNE